MKGVTMQGIIILLLSLGLGVSQEIKTLRAIRAEIPPKIDGYLEEVWTKADSATDFIQRSPNWEKPSTERTVVYLLYDNRNIYVAFKCYDSHPEQIDIRPTRRDNLEGDQVVIVLDTFNDNLTGYSFAISAANVQGDMYIFSDTEGDDSWNGVWYSAVQKTNFGYTVEVQIPFKTLRYKEGLTEWGIDFSRFIPRKREQDWWSFQLQDGFRVSRMGRLIDIHPPKKGFSFRGFPIEPYPVGLVRWQGSSASPELGLDISWKPSPETQLLLTFNPDFAQVEADPYKVNLGRFPLYYSEKRPFFVEGAEVFSTPLKLFYSRMIGKGLPDGKRVPIRAALKFTGKPGRWTFGAIGTWTGKKEDEPESGYYVFRVKRSFWRNSELGVLFCGKRWEGGFNEVFGVDGAFRKGLPRGYVSVSYQVARSRLKGAGADYAGKVSLSVSKGSFWINGSYSNQGEDFDIGQIGFEPRKGTERAYLGFGYSSLRSFGPFKHFYASWGVSTYREYISPYFKAIYSGPSFGGTFRNNWSVRTQILFLRCYDTIDNRWYTDWFTENKFNTDSSKPFYTWAGFWYHSKRRNWRRGYVAPQAAFWAGVSYRPNPGFKIKLGGTATVEWKPDGSLEHISWVWGPTLDWSLAKDLYFRWWNEINTDTDIHRSNLLLSWNFLPKSWIYLAFNQSIDTSGGKVKFKDRIFVAKVRWLFSI